MGQTKIFRGWFRPLLCSALNHVVTARTCWNLHFLTRFPVFYCGVCVRLFFSHLFFVFCFVTRSRTEQKRTHGMPRCDAFVCKCAPTGWWSSSRLKSSRSSHRIVFFFQICGRLGGFRVGWGAMTFLMLQLQWQTWNEGPPEDRGSPMRIIIPVDGKWKRIKPQPGSVSVPRKLETGLLPRSAICRVFDLWRNQGAMTRVCLKITNMTQNPCLAYLWGY